MSELKNNIYTWFSFKELALLKEGVKETDYRVKEAKFAAITTAVGISEDPSEEEVIEKCEEQLKHKEFYDYTSDIDKRELLNRLHSDLTLRDFISDQDKDKYKEVLESIWNNPDFSSYFSLYSIKDVDKENHRIFYPAVHAIVLAEMDKQKQTNYSKELVSIEELFNSYFDHEIKTTKRIRVTPEEKTYINNMPRGTWAHFIREWEIEESKGIKRAYPFSAQETILPSKVIRTNPSPDIAGERTQVFFEGSEEGKYLIDHGLDARFNYDPKGISLALTSLKKFHDEDNASSVTLYDMSIEAMRDWIMASIALEKEGLSIKVKIAPEMRNLVYTDEFKRQMEAYRNFIQPEEKELSSLSEKEENDSVSQEETEELVKLREKAQQAKQFVDEMELSENKLITPLKNLKEETLQQLVEKGIDIDRIPAFNALFSTQEKLREENDKLIMDVINNAKNFEQICQKYFSEIDNGTNSISSKENVATAEANLDASIEEWNKFARLNWENIKDVSDILDTKEIATNDLEDTKVEQEQYSSYAEEIQKEMETAQQWQKPLNEQEENDFNLKLLDAENSLQSEQIRNEQEENDLNLAKSKLINIENRLQFERIRQEQLARDLAEEKAAEVQPEEQAIPVVDEESEITEKAEVDTTISDEELKTNNEQEEIELAEEKTAEVQAEEQAIPVVDEESEITVKAEVDTTTSDEELKTNNEQDRLAEINRINAENRLQFEQIRQEQIAKELAEEKAAELQAEKIRREAAKEAESLAKNASKYALENEQLSKFLDNVINSLEEPYGNMESHNIKPSEIESSDEFIKFFNALKNQVSIYSLHDYLSLDYAKKASAWSDLQTLAIDKKIDNKEIYKAKKEFKKAQDELSSFIEKNRNSEEKDFSVYLNDLKQLISKKIKVRESSLGSVDPEKLLSMEKRTPVKKETKNLFVDHPEYEGTHWIFDLETGMCILNDRTKEDKQEQLIENLPEDAQIYDYVPGKQETKKIVQDTVNGKAKFFYISVNAALKDLPSFIRFVEEAESMQVSFAVKGSEEEIKMLNLSIQQQKENTVKTALMDATISNEELKAIRLDEINRINAENRLQFERIRQEQIAKELAEKQAAKEQAAKAQAEEQAVPVVDENKEEKISQNLPNNIRTTIIPNVQVDLKDLAPRESISPSLIANLEYAKNLDLNSYLSFLKQTAEQRNTELKDLAVETSIPLDHKNTNVIYDLAKTEDKERALKNKRSWVSGVKATLTEKITADKSIPDDQVISYAEKLTDYMSKYQETLEQIIKQETRSLDKNMILTEVVKKIGTFEKFESGVNTIVIKRSNNIQNVAVGKASVISKILTEEGALATTEVGAISIKRSDLLNKKKQTQKNPLKAKMYQKRQALALAAKNKSKD